jgi:hypothetical protein
MKKPRTGSVYVFRATGWDVFDRRRNTPENGTRVRIAKSPYGCPPNGTMGHTYVETLNGEFIGLVLIASLHKE